MRGVGKSTVGEAVARRRGVPFFDTDRMLEMRWGMSVRKLFEGVGADRFRELEGEVLREADGGILSVGGGTVLCPRNREVLKKRELLVCLYVSKGALRTRWREAPLSCGAFDVYFKERLEALSLLSCVWISAEEDVWRVIDLVSSLR